MINKVFGKLLVIEKSSSIIGGKKVKRTWGRWLCKCSCGKEVLVKTVDLNRGKVSSCGCLKKSSKSKLQEGDKVNRLYLLKYNNGKWQCSCECGNIIKVKTNSITSGNTKSCGCLKEEISRGKVDKLIAGRRQFEPKISSARRRWQSYCFEDKNCDISFEDFYKISQMNCYYCGVAPSITFNYFKANSTYASKAAKETGDFVYNGLDRIDNSKDHTLDNVVPCCYICNRGKNKKLVNDFYLWINKLVIKDFKILNIEKKKLPENSYLQTSIKCVFYNYKSDSDLTLEEFYSISQMNCYYCNSFPNNTFNRAKSDKKASLLAKESGDYIYNGLDRIDSSKGHNKNNVVPCCKYCNFAKSKLSLKEFNNWIIRIKEYQKNKGQE